MKKVKIILSILLIIYTLICTALYFIQESLLFRGTKLPEQHVFKFDIPFEEVNLKTEDNFLLNHLLFKADSSKGVVLFFHGNGGTLEMWGHGAALYTNNGYDILYLDYRSYGKSTGSIISEKQFINDGQISYDFLKEKYGEENIIISGTSMGTGLATQIAAKNNPKQLILNAPYASMKKVIQEKIRIVPGFIIKYKLESKNYINRVKCPITIFHGTADRVIPFHHAKILKEINPKITFHTIEGAGHYLRDSEIYFLETAKLLK